MKTLTLIELQTSNSGSVAILANEQRTIRDGAEGAEDTMNALSFFHSKCALAAISKCDKHTISLVDDEGNVWRECKAVFPHAQTVEE